VRSFRVSCVRIVYRAFVSCIVRFLYRSCEAFVRFSFVSFAFFVRLCLVRIVNLYDPGSVLKGNLFLVLSQKISYELNLL
jgi:hypothetical protein